VLSADCARLGVVGIQGGRVSQVQEYGAVFTRSWVVELMLDLCGYVAGEDLARGVAVEPSCGGAFLLPMIARLSASLRERGGALAEAKGAIRAFGLQEQHVEHARAAARDLLEIDDFLGVPAPGWERLGLAGAGCDGSDRISRPLLAPAVPA